MTVPASERLRALAGRASGGVWAVSDDAPWQVEAGSGWRVAHCGTFPGTPDPRPIRAEADARLIALAPDLAVLLADALDALAEHVRKQDSEYELMGLNEGVCDCEACAISRAILARAGSVVERGTA